MAHSLNYESKLNHIPAADKQLVQKLTSKPLVFLSDATAKQGNQLIFNVMAEFNIFEDQLVFFGPVKSGIVAYCKLINRNTITLDEAARVTRVVLMAILWKRDNGELNPMKLSKSDLVAAAERNNLMNEALVEGEDE